MEGWKWILSHNKLSNVILYGLSLPGTHRVEGFLNHPTVLCKHRSKGRQWETGFRGVKYGTVPDVGLVQGPARGGVTERG